ncbi:hypothetical protein AB1Y20_005347 [Prymnesium parvum]|uniref:Uncharacterized protein n=1 Tax=Prymnesium parvum TaxID=97485 RepID=A0AB34J417_PRYPA
MQGAMAKAATQAGPCGSWARQHSGASEACIWYAARTFDVHSLLRQTQAALIKLMKQRRWWLPAKAGSMPKLDLVELIITMASLPAERCMHNRTITQSDNPESSVADSADLMRQYFRVDYLDSATPVTDMKYISLQTTRTGVKRNRSLLYSATNNLAVVPCGPVSAFNNRLLPYRWLPGLPFTPPTRTRLESLMAELNAGERIEVMHTADFWPGPIWLYAAPGSGVWWNPGRHIVALNLVDAVLRFVPLRKVVEHLKQVRNGDRRFARYRNYLQWRAAFASAPWERVLLSAAAGNGSFAYISAAGELLSELLTSLSLPSIDSIVLLRQMHYWPRGEGFDVHTQSDDMYAPTMVAPCAFDRSEVPSYEHTRPTI